MTTVTLPGRAADEVRRARALLSASITEADFMRDVLQAAGLLGWSTYHTRDSRGSDPGWPDVVLCRPPRLLVLELKTEKGRVTPDQQAWVDRLAACGIDARVVRPADWDEIEGLLR